MVWVISTKNHNSHLIEDETICILEQDMSDCVLGTQSQFTPKSVLQHRNGLMNFYSNITTKVIGCFLNVGRNIR